MHDIETVAPCERAAFTVAEFCAAHRVSRSSLYKAWAQGTGPRYLRNGKKVLITIEAARDWRREREAASAQPAAEMHTETAA
jgi:hypothetical protein